MGGRDRRGMRERRCEKKREETEEGSFLTAYSLLMAATTIYRQFPSPDSNHESRSLRSFRVPTSPPSLKASSLKLRGSLSSFIGIRGRSRLPEPTLKDLQAADDALILAMGLSTCVV